MLHVLAPARFMPDFLQSGLGARPASQRLLNVVSERSASALRGHTTVAALAQVFGNLVANAIRHNPSQRPSVRVRALPHPADPRFVEVVVQDDGPGFPEAVRDRFEQGLPRSTRGNTGGFGLLIVRQVVEALGGRVWLEAPSDGGAAVHFTIPAR